MNQHSIARLNRVHPELAHRVQLALQFLDARGIHCEVVQGLRTFAEQDALYAQGRTHTGKIVTNARAGHSNHNFGLAVDLVPFVNGQPQWNAPADVWERIGQAAEAQGLEWGGRWKSFVDRPHIQLSGLSIAQCLKLYRQGGIPLIWQRASAAVKAIEEPQPVQAAQSAPVNIGNVTPEINDTWGTAPPVDFAPLPAMPERYYAPDAVPLAPVAADPLPIGDIPAPSSRELSPQLITSGVRTVLVALGGILGGLGVVTPAKFSSWSMANLGTITSAALIVGPFLWSWYEKKQQGKKTNAELHLALRSDPREVTPSMIKAAVEAKK